MGACVPRVLTGCSSFYFLTVYHSILLPPLCSLDFCELEGRFWSNLALALVAATRGMGCSALQVNYSTLSFPSLSSSSVSFPFLICIQT